MKDYLVEHGSAPVPQSEPLRPDQVPNSAGGYAWPVDNWTRLRRFLILGSEGGSYYAAERDLTKQNLGLIRNIATTDGVRLVSEIVAISSAGRAPKNDPALYALAVAMSEGDKETRRAAAEALPQVARIGTHLFHFVAYLDSLRGWGKTARWAVANWYEAKPADKLAYDVVKYQQRDGISHRDVLRLAHPAPASEAHRAVFGFVSGNVGHRLSRDNRDRIVRTVRPWRADYAREMTPEIVEGFLKARDARSPSETAKLIREYRLPWETVQSEHRTDPEVWRALLDVGMPVTALVRNLGNLARLGVTEAGQYRRLVLNTLTDGDLIRKSRIHPLALLLAQVTYREGRGFRGSNTWQPVPAIIDALDEAFYLAFGNVIPTGKRILQAIDISGSMDGSHVAGTPLSARAAASALALVTVNVENDVDTVTFSCAGVPGGYFPTRGAVRYGYRDGIEPYPLSRRQRLDDVVRETERLPMGGTDCALPMLYAAEKGLDYDAIIIYTDSETWAGGVHPAKALTDYRRTSGNPTRLIVVGMVSNGFTIADPNDAGMLDVVGFDTATPEIIGEFVAGRI